MLQVKDLLHDHPLSIAPEPVKGVTSPKQRHGGQAVEICKHRADVNDQARGRIQGAGHN